MSKAIGMVEYKTVSTGMTAADNMVKTSNVEILHPWIYILQVVEFVIVSSEKGLGSLSIFMDKFNDRAGNGHSVICRSSSSDLIKKHKGARREIMEDH